MITREELREARRSLGFTQQKMAEACGMALRTYQDIESGLTEIRKTHDKLFGYVIADYYQGEKVVFEQDWVQKWFDVEARGAAKMYTVCGVSDMEVRLQSYDETKVHETFKKFEGKRVRVTVEVVE